MNTAETICPFCLETIKTGAIRCKHCHADLHAPPAPNPEPAPVPAPSLVPVEIGDLLSLLIDKSLVLWDPATDRYRMLESVRDYGRVALAEVEEAARTLSLHQEYFAELVEEAEPLIKGSPRQSEWLERLETEHDNLRAALEWDSRESGAGKSEVRLRLAGALWPFWRVRSYFAEGRDYLARVLSEDGAGLRTRARAKALQGLGIVVSSLGDLEEARKLYEENLSISRELGHRPGISAALNNLGLIHLDRGEYEKARTAFEESLTIDRESGDPKFINLVLNNLGLAAHAMGDREAARSLFEQSLALGREAKDPQGTALALLNLGGSACEDRDYPAARSIYEESLSIYREMGDKFGAACCLGSLRRVAEEQGDFSLTRSLQGECLEICRDIGAKSGIASSLEVFANLARVERDVLRAARLWGAAEALRERMGFTMVPDEALQFDERVALARSQAADDEGAFARAWKEGRGMTPEQAVAFALEG